MGLFGSKKMCPICGQPAKGVFNIKIKDKLELCQDCSGKVNMDHSMLPFQTVDNIKEHLAYRGENQRLFNQFTISREIKTSTIRFRVDENLKKWYYTISKNPDNPPIYGYDEIVDYELTEDGETISKGGVGRAVAGGLLFGGVGAVVGGVTGGKKTKTVVKSIKLKISLNNKYHNFIELEFIPMGMDCKSGSLTYNTYKQQADSIVALLDSMCSQASKEQSSGSVQPAVSSADELMKFKELLDKGVITQEEFEAKKKQLLGL